MEVEHAKIIKTSHTFELKLGPRVNFNKSQIIFDIKSHIIGKILGCPCGAFSITYLGLLLRLTAIKKDWLYFIRKKHKKLQG